MRNTEKPMGLRRVSSWRIERVGFWFFRDWKFYFSSRGYFRMSDGTHRQMREEQADARCTGSGTWQHSRAGERSSPRSSGVPDSRDVGLLHVCCLTFLSGQALLDSKPTKPGRPLTSTGTFGPGSGSASRVQAGVATVQMHWKLQGYACRSGVAWARLASAHPRQMQ